MLRLMSEIGPEAERYKPELDILRHNLSLVFRNPTYPLAMVESEYLAGRGSNEVLDKAFYGQPPFVRDWFRVGQVSVVALEGRARGLVDPLGVDLLAIENHLVRGGVPERDRRRLMETFHGVCAASARSGARVHFFQIFDNQLQQLAAEQDKPIMKPNIWVNGSFFLVALLSIFVAIRVLSGEIAPIWIALVFVGGILAVLTIGILALRANDQFSDKTFLQALGMVLRSLPLIGRAARRP